MNAARTRLGLFLILFVQAQYTKAQTLRDSLPADSLYRETLAELVVTARRSPTPRFNTPEAIEGLGEKTIRRQQYRTAPEALQATPGVFVQKTNHGGGSPFLRGLTGNQTLLLIDGIRLSNATFRYGPNQYFNTLDVFSIERFEVLRGSGSVQYGSDALGGAIQAFSREAALQDKPRWRSEALWRGATHG
ncbi:MAG: Plug domain-containing protein, partial [Thermoanaerobaculia bacterium]|nr:Plug domain-containing protein [Thermoanaerobaculia bacterium]